MNDSAMERLGFGPLEPHEPLEAAIHLARYALARPLCRGRRVLDAACGAGYGSSLLSGWGAESVDGVDIASDAVASANELFASPTVRFHQHSVEALEQLFSPGQFQLAVSLETVEHVSDPAAFLEALRRVVPPDGTIVVSCPNDHWYYPRPGEGNPHHRRRFTFGEFRAVAEAALGAAAGWLLGTMGTGFVNVPVDTSGAAPAPSSGRMAMLDARPAQMLLVPSAEAITAATASYFVGVWGPAADVALLAGGAVYPQSMDSAPLAALKREVSMGRELTALRGEVMALQAELDEARRTTARSELRERTVQAEAGILREAVQSLQFKLDAVQAERAAHSCFETLQQKFTDPLPAPAGRLVSWVSGRARSAARRLLPR